MVAGRARGFRGTALVVGLATVVLTGREKVKHRRWSAGRKGTRSCAPMGYGNREEEYLPLQRRSTR